MDELDTLLDEAAAAGPSTRIEFRDRIALFGTEAIVRLEPWLSDPRLGSFAVRTIERAVAISPDATQAARAAIERAHADGRVADDIAGAIARLGGRTRTLALPNSRGPGHWQDRPAGAQAGDAPLLGPFDAAMLEVYEAAKREAGYRAIRFLQKVRRDGGLETAHYLLRQPGVSKGFVGLWKAACLDLTVEYLVLQPKFAVLFPDDELAVARQRLLAHGLTTAQLPS